jgi:hypothetical protein
MIRFIIGSGYPEVLVDMTSPVGERLAGMVTSLIRDWLSEWPPEIESFCLSLHSR